ncbi:MAG: cation transporter, partial [Alphaproteobacteria bacterium]|nr:cation transporter [Alphaproteobacteria bacterium]
MDCASCGRKIDTAIRRLPGVEDVSVAVQTGVLKIRHDGDLADEAVLQQLRNLGYSGEAASPTSGSVAAPAGPPPAAAGAGGAPWWWTGKARLTALCGLALLSAYGLGTLFPSLERYAFLAALAVGLIPIASRAFSAARHGTPFSIEMLMTIAAVGAVFIGAAEEA